MNKMCDSYAIYGLLFDENLKSFFNELFGDYEEYIDVLTEVFDDDY